MKFENVQIYNFEGALRGMRNPKNSWDKSDSIFVVNLANIEKVAQAWTKQDYPDWPNVYTEKAKNTFEKYKGKLIAENHLLISEDSSIGAIIGPKDMKLAKALISGGSEHRKFLRQIMVSVDITAPLYVWKEFDTYKVGTVANSTSTMHKLADTPITADCFEPRHTKQFSFINSDKELNEYISNTINFLEQLRQKHLTYKNNAKNEPNDYTKELQEENAYDYWKEIVRWLPEGWLQKRTVTMNYENLLSMYHQRKNHKLTEWSNDFMNFIISLPYATDFIMN